jgi:hypothetical protein
MKILKESLPRPRLSVAMIVRDEQDVLADSVESVRPIADEIVVLDTGSKDQTVAIARRLGAAVQRTFWANDFSAARNHCLRFVTGDWVLWLDAGERLALDSTAELRQFLDEKAERDKVYHLWIEAPPREPNGSAEQVVQPRLMPAGAQLRFQGRVRETLEPALRDAGMATGRAPGCILLHDRQHDVERSLLKARRDLSLAAMEAQERGQSPPRLLLAAGEAHSVLGDLDKAREAFHEAIRTAERGSKEMLEAYYGLLTALGDDAQLEYVRLTSCMRALEVFPFDIQLLLALGNNLVARDRPGLAIRAFDAAVRFGRATPEVWHLRNVKELAAVCLRVARQRQQSDNGSRTPSGGRRLRIDPAMTRPEAFPPMTAPLSPEEPAAPTAPGPLAAQ